MDNTKIEGYLINLGLTFRDLEENAWIIDDPENGLSNVVVFAQDSLVTIRTKVMDLPSQRREEFFHKLLALNSEMIHGAYALDENNVILIDTLELATMDIEEFQASLDATGLALAQHYGVLSEFRK
ncbi:MAG: hypothetical protein GVY29_06155 [Spirochaetes bacterium]|jgi:hypothetical protein|nr:hypothetical protein [Spirochaetota bacterium]